MKNKESIEDRFTKFNRNNPKVYELFKKFCLEAIKKGRKKLGSKMIIERIRWHASVETTDEEFKISNDYTAHYARLFMRDYPDQYELFNTKPLRS